MENKTMFEIVSSFRATQDSDLEQSYFGEVDIIINKNTLVNQDPCTQHSDFVLITGDTAYVAGISGLQGNSFTKESTNDPNQEDDFYHTTSSWNNVVIDAEKSNNITLDTMMCWAATDSNMLYRTGWLTSSSLTVDDVFDNYRSAFTSGNILPGSPLYGARWYLTGLYEGKNNPTLYDQLKPFDVNHPEYEKGYFSDSVSVFNLNNYVVCQVDADNDSTILVDAMNQLRSGNAVGLVLHQYTFGGGETGHVITLQGYTYQTIDSTSIKITGVIIADSDDDKGYLNNTGGSFAPNKLVFIPVHNVFGDVYLDWNYLNYMNEGWSPAKIIETTTVKPAKFTTLYNNEVIVSSAATFQDKTISSLMELNVSSGGLANRTVLAGGSAHVFGGGKMILDNQAAAVGSVTLGGQIVVGSSVNCNNLNLEYQLDANTPVTNPLPNVNNALITNLSNMGGISTIGLNVTQKENFGHYTLAESGGNFNSNGTVVVTDLVTNSNLATLSNGWTFVTSSATSNGIVHTYTLEYSGGVMTLEVGGTKANQTTRCDLNYNGISDVIRWKDVTDGQNIQYALDGSSEYHDEGVLGWDTWIIGAHDINWDHSVDLVTCRSTEYASSDYLVIEYAQSGDLGDLHEIDRINNSANVDWNVYCGNLAGHDWKNSILWHAPDLGALGYWADGGGNESWVSIGTGYDYDWQVLGLGDFTNDSVRRDSVLFKYGINTIVEITASGGYRTLGTLGNGWEVATIGDFSNDGVDDLILYNAGSGLVGKWADGVNTGWSSLGTVETGVAIEGAGDYNGDGSMDLLARKSDGTMGYYASANVSQFTSFGYAMDSSWTVIA